MNVRLVVLGAGQDGGSPQMGTPTGTGVPRTASSIAVLDGDQTTMLFDASPDLREQYLRVAELQSGRTHPNPFDAVFVTHGHIGHYAGLVHFGKEAAATSGTPLFAPASVLEFFEKNQPWAALLQDGYVNPTAIERGPAAVGRFTVTAVAVPHRAEFTSTVGYSIAVDDHPWVLYLPDIDSWNLWQEAESEIERHDVCLLDATFTSLDELPRRHIDQLLHPLVSDTLPRFAHMTDSTQLVLTHMNHSNQLADPDSDIAALARQLGFVIARDGMVIDFGGHP